MYKIGMPSDKESVKNKNLLTYSCMILQSNYNSSDEFDDRRYLYKNKLDLKEMENTMKISQRTIKSRINMLIKTDLVETVQTEDGLVYKFNYKKDDKYFVEIENDILKQLCHTSSNVIATYILMKYHLRDGAKQMTREFIAEEIGLSSSSERLVTDITKVLAKLGLIAIYEHYKQIDVATKDGTRNGVKKVNVYELISYDDWKIFDKIIVRKIDKEEYEEVVVDYDSKY